MWSIIALIAIIGALGGLINAILGDDKGFVIPKKVKVGEIEVFRPGILGNVLVGAFSAFVSWAMYGPHADLSLLGNLDQTPDLTVATYGLAALVGFGGARWLTSMTDEKVLKEAVSLAAEAGSQETQGKTEAGLGFGSAPDTNIAVHQIPRETIQHATPMKIVEMVA